MPYLNDLDRFYSLLDKLKIICCNKLGFDDWINIKLADCDGHKHYWNECKRGIYLFFDENEKRDDNDALRVVRVGTHAIKKDIGKATLWDRLKQHKGNDTNCGGNHRGSKFRELVGEAMIEKDNLNWDIGLEGEVSKYIRNLPFLILRVDPESDDREHMSNCNNNDRKYLESNIIGLLSDRENPDDPSETWLGSSSRKCQVRESGLWQIQGVGELYENGFLDVFEHYIDLM